MSLATRYMGLELANPVIVSSSGLTGSVAGDRACAEAGAGAIVLKSLYEEQIHAEADAVLERSHLPTGYPEGRDHLELYSQEQAFERYLKLIREAKEAVSIPVIASVHCVSASGWTEYTRRIQAAGADALELNVFVLPMDIEREPRAYEKLYLDIVKGVRRNVSVPLALEIGPYFSGLAHTALELSWRVDALVLFNRFYRLDIDIEELRVVPAEPFSNPQECVIPMRWIAILAGKSNATSPRAPGSTTAPASSSNSLPALRPCRSAPPFTDIRTSATSGQSSTGSPTGWRGTDSLASPTSEDCSARPRIPTPRPSSVSSSCGRPPIGG